MKQRVLAIIGALGLIAVAWFVPARCSPTMWAPSGTGSNNGSKDRPVVACTPDLASVCESLAAKGKITAADGDLDLTSGIDAFAKVDGWITWDPAPSIDNFRAPADEARWEGAQPIASSERSILLDPRTSAALATACPASGSPGAASPAAPATTSPLEWATRRRPKASPGSHPRPFALPR